jgi:uncharacterized protein (TIGR00369 family)
MRNRSRRSQGRAFLSLRLLRNTFGFEARCFVCDPNNDGGMKQQFYFDEDARRVVADFTPGADHSGAPNYAHGGAIMAVLDDAMAWAVIAVMERFGVTRKAKIEFLRPVRVGKMYRVEAWVETRGDRSAVARGEIRSANGKLCAAATASYVVMTQGEAQEAIGVGATSAVEYTGAPG